MYPEDLHYTEKHAWVRALGDIGVLGITHHAQQQLGDIMYVDLPQVGSKIERGEIIGSVESVKEPFDIYSPVFGEITEINELLATAPDQINEDPYGSGWLLKVRLSGPGEIGELLSAADYEQYVASIPSNKTA